MNQFSTPRSKGHTRSFSYSGSCHKENVPQSNLPSVNQSLSLLKKQSSSLLKKVGSTSLLSDYNAIVGDNGYSVHKIIKSLDVKSMACANEQEVWCGDRRGEITVINAKLCKQVAGIKPREKIFVTAMCSINNNMWAGMADGTINIYNIRKRNLLKVLYGHIGTVTDIVYLGENTVATSSADFTIRIWDCNTFNPKTSCVGLKSWVNTLCSVSGSLWSGSDDSVIRVWDLQNNVATHEIVHPEQKGTYEQENFTSLSFRGVHGVTQLCHCPVSDRVWSASRDSTVKVWNPVTFNCERKIEFPSHVNRMHVAGKHIWIASNKELTVWSLENRELLGKFAIQGFVSSMANVGSKVWIATSDKTVRVYKLYSHDRSHLNVRRYNLKGSRGLKRLSNEFRTSKTKLGSTNEFHYKEEASQQLSSDEEDEEFETEADEDVEEIEPQNDSEIVTDYESDESQEEYDERAPMSSMKAENSFALYENSILDDLYQADSPEAFQTMDAESCESFTPLPEKIVSPLRFESSVFEDFAPHTWEEQTSHSDHSVHSDRLNEDGADNLLTEDVSTLFDVSALTEPLPEERNVANESVPAIDTTIHQGEQESIENIFDLMSPIKVKSPYRNGIVLVENIDSPISAKPIIDATNTNVKVSNVSVELFETEPLDTFHIEEDATSEYYTSKSPLRSDRDTSNSEENGCLSLFINIVTKLHK